MSEHIYNVTVVVNPVVEERWLKWMREEHIPNVMETGLFSSFLFTQVFPEQEQDHPSYSIQYRYNDVFSPHRYIDYIPSQLPN